ncbi:hypothetical protein BKA61DRAFT_13630 [Leptodontidium sp. MPI-SDFR-AT-0119]|nr:hypothetical protein BKA61DRAFT_13630 [Leptodontidium sp. MPI-SDFR-AT-0119]
MKFLIHTTGVTANISRKPRNNLVKPTDAILDLVHDWLDGNGTSKSQLQYSPTKYWISIPLPVRGIERLLDTSTLSTNTKMAISLFERQNGPYHSTFRPHLCDPAHQLVLSTQKAIQCCEDSLRSPVK